MWKQTGYRIEYITGIGADAPSTQTGSLDESEVHIDSKTLAEATVGNLTYTFKGWCDIAVGKGGCNGITYNPGNTIQITEDKKDIKLYAIWLRKDPCFAAGTLVDTPDGLKSIEDLNKGEIIYAYDLDKGELTTDIIEETYRSVQENVYKLTLDDGSIIQGTQYHPFYNWIDNNWQPLGNFDPGSTIITINNKTRTSIMLEAISGQRYVYNIKTKKYHDYIIVASKDDKFLVLAVPPDDVYLELVEKNPQIVQPQLMSKYFGEGEYCYLENPAGTGGSCIEWSSRN